MSGLRIAGQHPNARGSPGMDNSIVELVGNAMIPYKLNLNPGDRLLIVADTRMDPRIVEAFMAGAVACGIEVVLAMSTPLPYHHADLSPMIVAAMDKADLVHV